MLKVFEESVWQQVKSQPDKIAIISGKKQCAYKELWQKAMSAKFFFENECNLKKGDRIIVSAVNQIGFVYAYIGAHMAGLIMLPVDSDTNENRLRFICKTVNPSLCIGLKQEICSLKNIPLDFFDEIQCSEIDNQNNFPSFDDVADILFTTGTTGDPKGVPLTNRNIAAAIRNINGYIGNTQEDIELLALPVSHSFGLGRVRCALVSGETLVLVGGFMNLKKIYRLMGEHKVSGFSMVPSSWRYIYKMFGDKISEYKDNLKFIEMGSSFFSEQEKKNLAEMLPNTRICMHYGLTEASRSAYIEFHEDKEHLSAVGKSLHDSIVEIFDTDGNMCKTGQEGELCVKGDHVTKGYINGDNSDNFFGEFFRTGDCGYKDSEGYIYLKSRIKELINVGGKKVSPVEVEEYIQQLHGIVECACAAAPDPDGILGEVVKAFIVKDKSSDIAFEDIAKYLKEKLETYKQPVFYEWIDEIPKTKSGKVQRLKLQVQYQGGSV